MKNRRWACTLVAGILLLLLAGCRVLEQTEEVIGQDEVQAEEIETETLVLEETEAPQTEEETLSGIEQFLVPDEAYRESEYAGLVVDIFLGAEEDTFWQEVRKGAKQAQADLGIWQVNVHFAGESDAAVQDSETAIVAAADFGDEENMRLQEIAEEKEIAYIGLEYVPEGDNLYVSTDHYAAGQLAATNFYVLLEERITAADKDEVLELSVLVQESWSAETEARIQGFLGTMVELIGYDRAAVEGEEKFARELEEAAVIIYVQGIDSLGELLEREHLAGIFAVSQEAAERLLEADQEKGVLGERVTAVGFDSGHKQLEAVQEGRMAGGIARNPSQIGYAAVQLAAMRMDTEESESVETSVLFYHRDNMESEELTPYLYQ